MMAHVLVKRGIEGIHYQPNTNPFLRMNIDIFLFPFRVYQYHLDRFSRKDLRLQRFLNNAGFRLIKPKDG